MFNIEDWRQRLPAPAPRRRNYAAFKDVWAPGFIQGPADAINVEACRNIAIQHQAVVIEETVPADVFILSVGEPDHLGGTRIGGNPDLTQAMDWPRYHGEPLQFLAQVDFSESMDICGELPGRLLLLFGHECHDIDDSLLCIWLNEPQVRRDCWDFGLDVPKLRPYYGERWRTYNMSKWRFADEPDGTGVVDLHNGTAIWEFYIAANLVATQIGSQPYLDEYRGWIQRNERIICTVSGVAPIAACDSGSTIPYPFSNHPEPIMTEEESEALTQNLVVGPGQSGLGLIHVLMNHNGETRTKSRIDFV